MLRSIRLGEADRVLHVYTQDRGRVGAVAKGVRRTKSRFGARLEPLSHVELMLHQGSGELQTVTGVELDPAAQRRAGGLVPPRGRAGRVAEAMLRLFVEQEANPRAFEASDAFPGRSRTSGRGTRAERPALDALGALFPVEAALALRLPAAPDELCGVRCDRCACRLLAAGGWGCLRAVRGGGAAALRGRDSWHRGAPRRRRWPTRRSTRAPAREALGVVTASYEYHGGFRLQTLAG